MRCCLASKSGYILLLLLMLPIAFADKSGFAYANGTEFYVNDKPFYFSGTNNYYLWYGNYNCVGYDANQGCAKEVLDDAVKMNLSVVRTWGFADGSNYWGSLQPNLAGYYDEANFQKMDLFIREASDRNLKIIFPLVNNWNNFGGMCYYAGQCNIAGSCNPSGDSGAHDQFYTNTCTKNAYKNYVAYFLNRTNTLTGIKYKDDPTIFAWQLANEPRAKSDPSGVILDNWIEEMSLFIKSIDSNHLVSTGEEGFYSGKAGWKYDGTEGTNFIKNHNHSNIDFATFHIYTNNWGMGKDESLQWLSMHINDSHNILKKPVLLGEFGETPSTRDEYFSDWYKLLKNLNCSGNLMWMLKDSKYQFETNWGINYPEDISTVSIIMNDSAYWKSHNVQLSPINHAPSIEPIPQITAHAGDLINITVNVTDIDGDYLFYSIDDAYNFNKVGNSFIWNYSGMESGNHTITVAVSDGAAEAKAEVMLNFVSDNACIIPTDGMVIASNVVFCNGSYYLPNGISVGSNVVLDCNGSEMYDGMMGESKNGIAVGGQNVTIKNCRIHSYRNCILLQSASNVTITGNYIGDLSGYCYHGVEMQSSFNNSLINNTFHYNYDIGAYGYVSAGNIIKNNNFTNNGKGIYFNGCSNNLINNNYFDYNFAGAIYLLSGSNNSGSNNLMVRNGVAWGQAGGFEIRYSDGNIIAKNNISDGYGGINVVGGNLNNITNNKMVNNNYNFGIDVAALENNINYIDSSNTVNGKPVYIWFNHKNEIYPPNSGFVAIVNSTNITIANVNGSNNYYGAIFISAENSTIQHSTFSNNRDEGIYIWHSNGFRINDNLVRDSSPRSIHIISSNNGIIENNKISNMGYFTQSITIEESSRNYLRNNTLVGDLVVNSYYNVLDHYNHNIDTTNKINNKPVYYYFGKNDFTLKNVDASLVMFAGSVNITVKNITLSNNSYLKFVYTNKSVIANNSLDSNSIMILSDSHHNKISDNSITGNAKNKPGLLIINSEMNRIERNKVIGENNGLELRNSRRNNISNNYIANNSYGIELEDSPDNFILFNDIVNSYSYGIYFMQSISTAQFNNIHSNAVNVLVGNYNASAENNWWGTAYCDKVNESINDCHDYNGDNNCLDYEPVLDAPYPIGRVVNCRVVDNMTPSISFVNPTLADGAKTNNNWIEVNVSSKDKNDASAFIDFDNSLVGWWRMDDIVGNKLVDYAGFQNATLSDSVLQVDGALGKGMKLNNTARSYINITNNKRYDLAKAGTISAWASLPGKCTHQGSVKYDVLFSKADNGSVTTKGYVLQYYGNNSLSVLSAVISDGQGHRYSLYKLGFNPVGMHYYVLTWNATMVRLYVDSVLVAASAMAAPLNDYYSSSALQIGTGYRSNALIYGWNGTVDDFLIFNRSLSYEEINGLYANANSKYVYRVFSDLSYGVHKIKAYAQNIAGKVNSTETRAITTNSTMPTILITNCSKITISGKYVLNNNIVNGISNNTFGSYTACIYISGNDVSLDCQGRNIDGRGTTPATTVGYIITGKRVNITNCNITQWYIGGWSAGTNVTTSSSKFSGSTMNWFSNQGDKNKLSNSIITGNDIYGVRPSGIMTHTVIENTYIESLYPASSTVNTDAQCGVELINVTGRGNKPILWINSTSVNLDGWNNNVSSITLCRAKATINNFNINHPDAKKQTFIWATNSYVNLTNSRISNAYMGVFFYKIPTEPAFVNVINTSFTNNYFGIYAYDHLNNASGNLFQGNNYGIYVYQNTKSSFMTNNILKENIYGIFSSSPISSGIITIYNNLFNSSNNFYQNLASPLNIFNTTNSTSTNIIGLNYFGGNFYANPSGTGFSQTCANANNDGFCDSSYNTGWGTDYLPLRYLNPGFQPGSIISSQSMADNDSSTGLTANNTGNESPAESSDYETESSYDSGVNTAKSNIRGNISVSDGLSELDSNNYTETQNIDVEGTDITNPSRDVSTIEESKNDTSEGADNKKIFKGTMNIQDIYRVNRFRKI